jgi:hypothetical protein
MCTHPDRVQIEFDLTSGTSSIRGIAGQHGLAPESVRRHVRDHMTAAARAALAEVAGAPGLTMAARLLDVADHARDIRAAAEAAGDAKLALSAGQAEARVLATLSPLDALGADIAVSIQDATDALTILGTSVRERPEIAAAIIGVLEARGRSDWADGIRKLSSNPISRIEIAP